jgi:hypothetical protein
MRQALILTVFFLSVLRAFFFWGAQNIDRSMLIAAETEKMANRRNSYFKSIACVLTDRREVPRNLREPTIFSFLAPGATGTTILTVDIVCGHAH